MPHDCRGTVLKVGDHVRIVGRVVGVTPGADTCNLEVEIIEPGTAPNGTYRNITTTASLVERLDYEPCPACGGDPGDCCCGDASHHDPDGDNE
jgi:hypothetical protein